MRLKDVLYLLSIYVDVECQVYCDFSLKGTASPNKVFKMFLIPDLSCILDFRIDGKSHLIHEYKTGVEGGEGTIKVQLARVLYKKDDNYIPYTFGSPKYLFIDTETTGLPEEEENYEPSYLDFNYWPYIVQVGYVAFDCKWNKISENSYIVSPDNYNIPLSSTRIHKITHEDAKKKGVKREDVFNYLNDLLSKVDYIIGHNVKFDINVLKCEIMRIKRKGKLKGEVSFKNKDYKVIDTMELGANVCRVPTLLFSGYKYPTLGELYKALYSKEIENLHNALADVRATVDCFNKLSALSIISVGNSNESNPAFIESEWLDTNGLSNFRIISKEYELDDGTFENRLACTFTNEEGRKKWGWVSNDSELTEGDIIDENTIEVLTFQDSGNEIYRLDADILDEEQGGWELVSSKKLKGIEDVDHIYVVNKRYLRPNGHEVTRKSMCFVMDDGLKRFIPLCKDSNLDIADTVDIESVRLYKYTKDGHSRYGVDGDIEKSNLGYAYRNYIDISSFEKIKLIDSAYVDSETRYSYFHRLKTDYEQLVIRIKLEDDEVINYDLDSNSNLEIFDDVDPQSIIIFTYKENGNTYEKADASKLEEVD